MLDAEYELVQQAFYTEPEDQSGWLYHRWLLGNTLRAREAEAGEGSEGVGAEAMVQETLAREAAVCKELADMESESKWPLITLARLQEEVSGEEERKESAINYRRLEQLDPMRGGYYRHKVLSSTKAAAR